MTAQLIPGKAIAAAWLHQLQQDLTQHRACGGTVPSLHVIQVGHDPASTVYVQHKHRACLNLGIHSEIHTLSAGSTQAEVTTCLQQLADDPTVHGILLQLPLPPHLAAPDLLECIPPHKDVDGFHPYHLGRLAQRRPTIRPCTPFGIMRLFEAIEYPLKGQHAVIVGASNIVGRPMSLELLLAGATITLCHRFTADLPAHLALADVVIVAVGKPGMIHGSMLKPNGVVIDVGISRLPDGRLVGDVDFESAAETARWITPVPGGVGPMTIAALLHNTVQCARDRHA